MGKHNGVKESYAQKFLTSISKFLALEGLDTDACFFDDENGARQEKKELESKSRESIVEFEKESLLKLLSIPEYAREILTDLKASGMVDSTFTGNSEGFFAEGERNCMLKKLTRISWAFGFLDVQDLKYGTIDPFAEFRAISKLLEMGEKL